MAAYAVQQAIHDNAIALGTQLLRHGGYITLVQDVLRSMTHWASESQAAAVTRAVIRQHMSDEHERVKTNDDLTGAKLDAAFATLKLLSHRLAALHDMAIEPSSNSTSDPGMTIVAQSWLLPHKPNRPSRYWQYGYEVSFTNTSDEPLQLVQKAWQVKELSGAQRSRASVGLLGMQPIINSGASKAFQTAITLNSSKGSMKGEFLLKSMVTGTQYRASVAPFALTPTPEQYSDPKYMPEEPKSPATQSVWCHAPVVTTEQQQQAVSVDETEFRCSDVKILP